MAACRPVPTYGRVDLVRDNDGRLAVMELELIEPELWLCFHPPAADRFAAVLVATIWGANFVVIERGLVGVPPLVFVALRFLVVIAAMPFVARPSGPLWKVLDYVGAESNRGVAHLLDPRYDGLLEPYLLTWA